MKRHLLLFFIACLLLPAKQLLGHATDQSYIFLSVYQDKIDGNFQAVSKDLNAALNLNLPKFFTEEDIAPHLEKIRAYYGNGVAFSANGKTYPVEFVDQIKVIRASDIGTFLAVYFKLNEVEEIPEDIEVEYDLFFETNKKHRALLIQAYNFKAGIINNEAMHSLTFTPRNTDQSLDLSKASLWKGFVAMVKLGIWHIWIGTDHIFFLLALVLPAVVRRREWENIEAPSFMKKSMASWLPVDKFKPAFWYILKIVTFFTIAHTITLSLAALGILDLPGRFVESIIALSIALAAFHNIKPIFGKKEWLIAFLFGLFHGFGFAGVLAEKGLSGEFMALSLLGFNIGVEVGQVLILLAVFPIIFMLRKTKIYPYIVFFGSIFLIIVAFYWTAERVFDTDIQIMRPFHWLLEQF